MWGKVCEKARQACGCASAPGTLLALWQACLQGSLVQHVHRHESACCCVCPGCSFLQCQAASMLIINAACVLWGLTDFA